jgi:hypothetical protein
MDSLGSHYLPVLWNIPRSFKSEPKNLVADRKKTTSQSLPKGPIFLDVPLVVYAFLKCRRMIIINNNLDTSFHLGSVSSSRGIECYME